MRFQTEYDRSTEHLRTCRYRTRFRFVKEKRIVSAHAHMHCAYWLHVCRPYRYTDKGYWSIDRFGTLPAVHVALVLSDRAAIIGDW